MYQKTTISAATLFGDFYNLKKFQNMETGFERCWRWPKEIGNGFMGLINLGAGLILELGDYRLNKSITINFELKSPLLVFGFIVPLDMRSSFGYRHLKTNDEFTCNSGETYISYLPEWQGMAEYPKNISVRSVGIFINPALLDAFMGTGFDYIPCGMRDMISGADEKHYHRAISVSANKTVNQIFGCPYQGRLKQLYLKAKVLELMASSMAQFDSETVHPKESPLSHDSIREARDILVNSLENPPSLIKLSKLVGINKNKLNQGFQQAFGTSVFDYLRIYRLEKARQILENKEMNVTEVSLEVGYTHQRNFTRAFKKHFGVNPKNCLY